MNKILILALFLIDFVACVVTLYLEEKKLSLKKLKQRFLGLFRNDRDHQDV